MEGGHQENGNDVEVGDRDTLLKTKSKAVM